MILKIKAFLQDIPMPLGSLLARIPYRVRPGMGKAYRRYQKQIRQYERWDLNQRKQFIVDKMRCIVLYAMENVPFYRNLYAHNRFKPNQLRRFDDIARIPIITKEMLRDVPLEERSSCRSGRYIVNTGGSSGATLALYILPSQISNEWAHMHTIWRKLGYREHCLKLGFSGRNLGICPVVYDGLRHQYAVSVYKDLATVTRELLSKAKRHRIAYLHGYPSALYEFAQHCRQYAPELTTLLCTSLRGAFLGSEFPNPLWRSEIEEVFDIPTVSWYGHTERTILAWEKAEPFVYHPFQTYGYCEIPDASDSGGGHLVGTSYLNLASPLIRYDTGDDVEPASQQAGLLESFRIRHGRVGEFVCDAKGNQIPLTALIFGRHHKVFNLARFVQVQQDKPGEMVVWVTPGEGFSEPKDWAFLFDSTGLDMSVTFRITDHPIRTPGGKVVLKVRKEWIDASASNAD